MEENIIKEPIRITFKINAPKTTEESIFNSIILALGEYKNIQNVGFEEKDRIKISNDLLMKAQRQIDDLIILEE